MKKRKKYLSALSIVLAIFVILILYFYYPRPIPLDTTATNTIGNESKNILIGGYVAKQGKSIVYMNKEKNALFIDNGDGKPQKIVGGDISDINIIGDWIYYVKNNKKLLRSINVWDLYRANVSTGRSERVIRNCGNVNIIGDTIYYMVHYDYIGYHENGIGRYDPKGIDRFIYTASLDGKDQKCLFATSVKCFYISDKQIYYLDLDSNLYCMNIKGEKQRLYNEDIISQNFSANETLYTFDGNIYSWDGSKPVLLS